MEKRFGFIGLEAGVTARHMWVLLYAAFVSIGLATFDAFGMPYVLSENVGVDIAEQGAVVGRLNVYTEILLLMVFTPFGVLSDRIGRRAVYAFGFVCLGIAYALFPYATSVTELALIRIFYSLGIAGVTGMLATVIADYTITEHRGRMVGLTGVMNGLGIVTSALLLAKLPVIFVGMGYSSYQGGQFTLFIVAGLCLMSALIVGRGLKPGLPTVKSERRSARELYRAAIAAAVENPRIAVAYASAFVARGDLVVVSTFLSLWAKEAGLLAGLSLQEAVAKAGTLAVTVSIAQLLFSPVVGLVLDKVDRLTGMATAMGIAAAAYLWVGFSPDPLALIFIPAALMLGMGESAAILSGAAVIGQEAKEDIRGSVVGLFNFCGSVGTLVIAVICGFLFDAWMPGAPFVFVGCINLLILVVAIRVRVRTGFRPPDHRAS